jgi:hypothetical protein
MLTNCIKLDLECADICLFAAKMMSGDSRFSSQICDLCASVCEASGEECNKHSNMEHCRKCAEVCSNCAEECRAMVKEGVM